MTTLSVWTFPDADGARWAESMLARLAARELITVDDAAMLTWPEGKTRPRTRQLNNLACTASLGDAFWGLLFGMTFYVPLLGGLDAAGEELPGGSLSEVGIDDRTIAAVRSRISAGTSALFVLTDGDVVARIGEELAEREPTLVRCDLDADQQRTLREVFAV